MKRFLTVDEQEEPYVMLKPRSHFMMGSERYEGYLVDILQRLAVSVGFELEIRLSRDGKTGELNSDGRWDGMIGEVISAVKLYLLAISFNTRTLV